MERTVNAKAHEPAPQAFGVGQCGSCRWAKTIFQFGQMKPACTVFPKQVLFAPNGQGGGQVITVAPVIEDLTGGCSMWAPHETGGTDDGGKT